MYFRQFPNSPKRSYISFLLSLQIKKKGWRWPDGRADADRHLVGDGGWQGVWLTDRRQTVPDDGETQAIQSGRRRRTEGRRRVSRLDPAEDDSECSRRRWMPAKRPTAIAKLGPGPRSMMAVYEGSGRGSRSAVNRVVSAGDDVVTYSSFPNYFLLTAKTRKYRQLMIDYPRVPSKFKNYLKSLKIFCHMDEMSFSHCRCSICEPTEQSTIIEATQGDFCWEPSQVY